jgi:hypothetical protein
MVSDLLGLIAQWRGVLSQKNRNFTDYSFKTHSMSVKRNVANGYNTTQEDLQSGTTRVKSCTFCTSGIQRSYLEILSDVYQQSIVYTSQN